MEEKFNKLKKKLNKLLKVSLLLLTYLLLPSLIMETLMLFGIDVNSLSKTNIILLNFGVDLLAFAIIVAVYFKTLKKDFKNFFNKHFIDNLEEAFKYWLIGFLVMVSSNFLIAIITNGTIATNEESIRSLIKIAPLYMAFSISLYAPICEELIFRKGIRELVNRKWLYIFVSGFVFGGLHVISSLTAPIYLLYLIPYCSLGFAFAYSYYKTKNIFSTITMHMMHNTMALVLYLIVGNL